MTAPRNLFADIPVDLPDELFEVLLAAGGVRVERIVSLGHASPDGSWYDQEWGEWVVLLAGAARLGFEGEAPFEMRPGDAIDIPVGRRHRVEWTDPTTPTVWLVVHYAKAD